MVTQPQGAASMALLGPGRHVMGVALAASAMHIGLAARPRQCRRRSPGGRKPERRLPQRLCQGQATRSAPEGYLAPSLTCGHPPTGRWAKVDAENFEISETLSTVQLPNDYSVPALDHQPQRPDKREARDQSIALPSLAVGHQKIPLWVLEGRAE